MTAEQMWEMCWPGVPFEQASLEDKQMFLAHAGSVRDFKAWKRSKS